MLPVVRTDNIISTHPLIVCGSQYECAQMQIEEAISYFGAYTIDIYPGNESKGDFKLPKKDKPIIARLICEDKSLLYQLSEIIPRFAMTIERLIRRLKPDGLGIIGGETAFHILRRLNVNCLKVYRQVTDVIACGVIDDGVMAGYPFVTKGGSVGSRDAIIKMIDYLKNGDL